MVGIVPFGSRHMKSNVNSEQQFPKICLTRSCAEKILKENISGVHGEFETNHVPKQSEIFSRDLQFVRFGTFV